MFKVKAKVTATATVDLIVTLKKWESGEIELDEIHEILEIDDVDDVEVITEF